MIKQWRKIQCSREINIQNLARGKNKRRKLSAQLKIKLKQGPQCTNSITMKKEEKISKTMSRIQCLKKELNTRTLAQLIKYVKEFGGIFLLENCWRNRWNSGLERWCHQGWMQHVGCRFLGTSSFCWNPTHVLKYSLTIYTFCELVLSCIRSRRKNP